MTNESKLWQMKKWPREWAERPLRHDEAMHIMHKRGKIYFWHNDVLFRRYYKYSYVHFDCRGEEYGRRTDKIAYDAAILGESFGSDDNPFNLILVCFFSEGILEREEIAYSKRKLSRSLMRALNNCAEQYSLKLCEMFALLDSLPLSGSKVDSKTIRNKVLEAPYPVFPFLPDRFEKPAIGKYHSILVEIIGDGKQYIDRLKSCCYK